MEHRRSQVNPAQIACLGCGYDLSGTAVGGVCPECGLAVRKSLESRTYGDRSCSRATAAMVWGIVSLAACMPLGVVAILVANSAKAQMASGGYSSSAHGMAKAGLVMGVISTCICAVYVLVLILMMAFK